MRIGRLLAVVFVLGLALAGPRISHAQDARVFTLQPGGTATVRFESFCIDYGKRFPDSIGLPPESVADPTVTGALNYALSKGYTGSDPKEVQFAIWQARGAQGAPATGTIGQEVSGNAGTQPAAPAGATSLIDAIKANQVKLTAGSWQGIGEKLTINNFDDNFQGRGELMVENTSDQALTLYMPIGTVFPAPSAEFQSMAGYPIEVQVNNPQVQQMPNTGLSTGYSMLLLLGAAAVASGALLRRRVAM